MKILSAEFVKGVVSAKELPQGMPEVAVWGRSNVGKSSLINYLCQRKSLVKTSATPGKTKELNFFNINQSFYLVDLPGAGYARMSKTEHEKLEALIDTYFQKSQELKVLLYLIDFYLGGTPVDEKALTWLDQFDFPVMVIGTKADKLSRTKWHAQTALVQKKFELVEPPILASANKAWSNKPIWESILPYLEDPE